MSRVMSPRRVLAATMGIAAMFDLTGATLFRTMRGVLPPVPPSEDDGIDPFRAAMGTIMSAYPDAMAEAHDESDVALAA
jgi:hypothetical protein